MSLFRISRSYASFSIKSSPSTLASLPSFSSLRLRPLVSAATANFRHLSPVRAAIICGFATRQTTLSLNDSNPNWSNRPPKDTILLDSCDFEHWLVVVEKPEGEPTIRLSGDGKPGDAAELLERVSHI